MTRGEILTKQFETLNKQYQAIEPTYQSIQTIDDVLGRVWNQKFLENFGSKYMRADTKNDSILEQKNN